ncbi:UDP-N-acetylmuramoyl-L-alanine--D-glutamate ligase [Psychroflexus sp. MES1-P1E]|uniref:UDP-N-acetylmuramoyl-L-alanine--D-glutamate ligase n=1 Tax=Psychroflexus sp. MES1-P1E TaxID=2058320 RepID=UPI000C7BF8AA|nr:UDP-N-acetylmuramoyl-L-alanine--D-glutamate ligase [Psychroflexus sp. MES1-P1E]PKG42418.1 UDP-N-acetylmuramoyl-L-alanine--D-glutamate ligase [Psychroflexus sp. MES1-P1E]
MDKLIVIGGGESGVGAAILGKDKSYDVFLSDFSKLKPKFRAKLQKEDIDFEEGGHTVSRLQEADLIVKSPGISDDLEVIKNLRESGIKIVSEIEFASWFTGANIIGITGSNGKTTVTNMVYHILKNAGLSVSMAGNVGFSFAEQVARQSFHNYVLELSSFQLDGVEDFRPHIAILTSITPDHLDRYHDNFQEYIQAKFKITKNQTKDDFLIYNKDDKVIVNWLEKNTVKAQLIPFTKTRIIADLSAFIEDNKINIKLNRNLFTMSVNDLSVKGDHNTRNAMAASTAARLLKIRKQTIRESMESFQGVEHRLEQLGKINKVAFINDSKATNINATFYALDSMTAPTVWIVGGVDKGNVYEELLPLVNEKVKAIVCLGIDNQKIYNSFSNCVDTIIESSNMSDAVAKAYELTEDNDAVLLSPACASFDLFENYEDRGRQFKEAIQYLKK